MKATNQFNPKELFGINATVGYDALKIAEDTGEEFIVRGLNVVTKTDDGRDSLLQGYHQGACGARTRKLYDPSHKPALVMEMDFADAESVREALALFGAKRVLEVRSEH